MSAVKNGRVPNAYLFAGEDSGTLLKEALFFAGLLNCASPADAGCGSCQSCQKIEKGVHPDVLIVSSEKNSIGIDRIREISDFVRFGPTLSGWKVIILDRADRMTEEASNGFLKTLEEPLNKVLFILTSVRGSLLLKTVISRCQKVNIPSAAQAPDPEADALARSLLSADRMSVSQVFALSEDICSMDEPEDALNMALYRLGTERTAVTKGVFNCVRALQRRANKRLAVDNMLLSLREG